MGGEKRALFGELVYPLGSPPRGRGKVIDSLLDCPQRGITPALAGKSAESSGASGRERDHPRVGGEKLHLRMPFSTSLGSPPHGRGKVIRAGLCPVPGGITPAWAGKRQFYSPLPCLRRDHPRMGGEKKRADGLYIDPTGSPPHGRGKARHLSHGLLPCG